jgi:hypothetical protein
MHFLSNRGKKVLVFQVDQPHPEIGRPNAHFLTGLQRERSAVHAQQKQGVTASSDQGDFAI